MAPHDMYFGHAVPAPAASDAAMAVDEDAATAMALAAFIAAAAEDGEPWPAEPAPLTAEEEAAIADFFETHPWPPLEELGPGAWINEN